MLEADHNLPSEQSSFELIDKLNEFVNSKQLIPPLSLNELAENVELFIAETGCSERFKDWLMVNLNNALWVGVVETIPYEKRVLLLPECLKNSTACPAEHDQFGLLCDACGGCDIGDILDNAEDLGMMTVVAEGSTVVADLLKSGEVEAVIGVSCLEALEKAFPNMISNATPGLAVCLTKSGCVDTKVNLQLLRQAIELPFIPSTQKQSPVAIKNQVSSWFDSKQFFTVVQSGNSTVERVGYENLLADGKRWRPYLTASIYSALSESSEFPDFIKQLAISVECFHKASLIHDDIEDDDDFRYEKPALHKTVGIGSAINVGDFLIGEGYSLISELNVSAELKIDALKAASEAHKQLTIGQGIELEWMKTKEALTVDEVINIFELKTSPAFEVALAFGAIAVNRYAELKDVLNQFSRNLGIAYQIRDDIDDFSQEKACKSPSVVFAIQSQNSDLDVDKALIKAERLFELYRNETFNALNSVTNRELKVLLFRVAARILKTD